MKYKVTMIVIPIHVTQNASAHMQTFLLLWQAEGQTPHNENKTKMATLSSHVTRRDTTMTPWPPHQACSVILEIYRESKFEKYKDRLLKQFTTEKRLCVCVWLNPHETQNINPRVENREDEEWDTEEEKQKETSVVSFRAQREDEREDEGASTRTEMWLVIKKYNHKKLFFFHCWH